MKSTSTGSAMARQRSLMNSMAPLSTADQEGWLVRVVGRDLGSQLRHPCRQDVARDQHGPDVGLGPRGHRPHQRSSCGHRRDTTGAARLHPEPTGRAAHPPAPRQLGRPRRHRRPRPRTRSTSASDGGCSPPLTSRASGAARGERSGGTPRHRPGVGRVGQRVLRQRLHEGRPRRAAARPGGRAVARGRGRPRLRRAAAARGGPGCGRRQGRRCSGHRPAPSPSGGAQRLGLGSGAGPSSGCRGPGSIPASPSSPLRAAG